MFKLCSASAEDLLSVFGRRDGVVNIPPKYVDLNVIMIGQKPDCSSYLFLSDQVVKEFTQHFFIPSGYDFIFRQSWGLTITEDVIHRVISTLREESYPPMAEYIDGIIKDDDLQVQNYIIKCKEVKEKYPKFEW